MLELKIANLVICLLAKVKLCVKFDSSKAFNRSRLSYRVKIQNTCILSRGITLKNDPLNVLRGDDSENLILCLFSACSQCSVPPLSLAVVLVVVIWCSNAT